MISNVDVLKSTERVMSARRKIKKETISNCFSKCGFNEGNLELFIDVDLGAEFAKYISEISPDSKVDL